MINVVFDTNVIISGKLWSGAFRQAINLVANAQVQSLITEIMIDELRDVLTRPKFTGRLEAIGRTAEEVVTDYLRSTVIVEAAQIPLTVQVDPDNDAVLACAVGGNANYVVTGDEHLLKLATFRGISILDVKYFLKVVTLGE
ncbi:MAG: putative toxin-antitoxin system toxin component, PIN family [Anaerolineae bacterium]